MTSDRFNLSEFSEYLDDTDGHRLAQYLQKKSGAIRNGAKRIFDCEPKRFSLNVRLKRLSSAKVPAEVEEVEIECVKPQTLDVDNEKDVQNEEHRRAELSVRNVLQPNGSPENHAHSIVPVGTINNPQSNGTGTSEPVMALMSIDKTICEKQSMIISGVKLREASNAIGPEVCSPTKISEGVQRTTIAKQNEPKEQPFPMCPELDSSLRLDEQHPRESQVISLRSPTFLKPDIPLPIVPRTPRSPKSKTSRSGGRSGDRLRRQVLKRLSNMENNGRRTLLKEFESTLASSDFSPSICSTPMHHALKENLLQTPPRENNSQNIPKTPERNEDRNVSQHTENGKKQQEQPFIQNMVEALEETIKKLKNIENPQPTGTNTPDLSIITTELQKTQDLSQRALVRTSTDNAVNKSKVLAADDLLQEVHKTLTDFRNSNIQSPKIIIPVNQTFNNVPVAAEKQISRKESNPEYEKSKIAQEAKSDQAITGISCNNMHGTITHSYCTRQHTRTESNLNEASNCHSPNNFINHPTFTRNDTAKTNLSTDSIQYNNVTSRRSLRTRCQQTFTKQNGAYTEKVHSTLGHEPSINQCNHTIVKTRTASTGELRMSGNLKGSADINKSNTSDVKSSLRISANMHPVNCSVHTSINNKTLGGDLVKQQTIVNQNNSVAHASSCTRANNSQVVPTETANKEKSVKHVLTEKSISLLLTDDEDEDDTHYTVNKRHILRKNSPLNLATGKAKITKRSRRTIKRPTRTHIRALARSLLTSDTETESGLPPAHPLNLQHVKPVEHKQIRQLRQRPLNKAPSTPKNGELFADELKAQLARLTNHEILDLRKRNSMDLMNGKRLRKSTNSIKSALRDKLKIEEGIQLEILRRELLGNTEGLYEKNNTENAGNLKELNGSEAQLLHEFTDVVNEIIFDELAQAPTAFKDSTVCDTKRSELNIDDSVPAVFKDKTALVADALKDNTAVALAPLKDNTGIAATPCDAAAEDNVEAVITPDAPEPFKDNTDVVAEPNEFNTYDNINHETILQLTHRLHYNSSLVDDRSSERVTFISSKLRNTTNDSRSRRRIKKQKEPLPEITKKYFEIEKSIKQRRKEKNKKKTNTTISNKRSLYSKGDSFNGDSEHSGNEKENSQNISTHMEPIPPPPIVSPISDIQIPPPPPPLSDTTASTYMLSRLSTEELILPPVLFSDERKTNSIASGTERQTLTTSHNNAVATQVANQTDDKLFKKPEKPAPSTTRKGRTRNTNRLTPSNVNETECTDDTETKRRSTRRQVPRDISFLTNKWNGHSLSDVLLGNISKTRALNSTQQKETNRTSSRCRNKNNNINSRGDDLDTPVASSTVNTINKKKRGRKLKQTQMVQAQALSYLSDLNVNSRPTMEYNTLSTPLQVIEETPVENEEHVVSAIAVAAAANDNDNELPTTSNSNITKNNQTTKKTTKGNRKTAATKEQSAKAKSNGRTRKTATGAKKKDQLQKQQQQEERDAVEAASAPALVDDNSNHSEIFECSRVYLPPPPSLEKLSEMFDELKNEANKPRTEETTSQSAELSIPPTVRNDPVRQEDIDDASTATSSTSTSTSNSKLSQTAGGDRTELLEWLKNISHIQSATDKQKVFMDMRPSTAGRLYFTDLDGVDYAFYDTKDKCSLGYLRFNPLQCKLSKRTKKYHLHFVVLASTFEFSTERERGNFGVGDMIAINIGCRYSIKNMKNEIGILMVIKK